MNKIGRGKKIIEAQQIWDSFFETLYVVVVCVNCVVIGFLLMKVFAL